MRRSLLTMLATGTALLALLPAHSLATGTTAKHQCVAYTHRLAALGPLDTLRGCLHDKCRKHVACDSFQNHGFLAKSLEDCDEFLLWHCELPTPKPVHVGANDFDCSDFVDSEEADDVPVAFLREHSTWFTHACPPAAAAHSTPPQHTAPLSNTKQQAKTLISSKVAPPVAAPPTTATNNTNTTQEADTAAPQALGQAVPPTGDDSSSTKTVVIISVAAGVGLMLIAGAVLAVLWRRRQVDESCSKSTAGMLNAVGQHKSKNAALNRHHAAGGIDCTSVVDFPQAGGDHHSPDAPPSPIHSAQASSPGTGAGSYGFAPARRAVSGLLPVSTTTKVPQRDHLAPVSESGGSGSDTPPPVPPKAGRGDAPLPTSRGTTYGDAPMNMMAGTSV